MPPSIMRIASLGAHLPFFGALGVPLLFVFGQVLQKGFQSYGKRTAGTGHINLVIYRALTMGHMEEQPHV